MQNWSRQLPLEIDSSYCHDYNPLLLPNSFACEVPYLGPSTIARNSHCSVALLPCLENSIYGRIRFDSIIERISRPTGQMRFGQETNAWIGTDSPYISPILQVCYFTESLPREEQQIYSGSKGLTTRKNIWGWKYASLIEEKVLFLLGRVLRILFGPVNFLFI
jgi:hypothetical protein